MRLLLPTSAPFATDPLDDDGLVQVYDQPDNRDPDRPWVRANFVSTLDGAATGADGRSGSINTGADREVFTLLRALSDVVIVGAGTARAEHYRAARTSKRWAASRLARRLSPHPWMAVVSRSANVPTLLGQPRDNAGEVAMITCAAAPQESLARARRTLGSDHVIVCGDDRVDLGMAVAELARRGMPRILCEGGPHLMQALAASGMLDELCLTLSPTLIGGEHPRIVNGPELYVDLTATTLIEADGALIGRWLRAGAAAPASG